MKKKIIHQVKNLDSIVTLSQTGKDSFTIEYGMHCTKGLNYADAASEYGSCIMHSAQCLGKLDA